MRGFSLETQGSTTRYSRKIHGIKGLTSREGIIRHHPSIPQKYPIGRVCAVFVVLILLMPVLYTFSNNEVSNDDNSPLELEGDVESPDLVVVQENTITFSAKEVLNTRKDHNITGTRGYSGTSPPVGDWVISGNAVVWNETITLNGDLTVTSTGNLTLINVTLKVNCGYNGEYHIEVQGGGGLYIYDFDWDRFTINDRSDITAANTAYKYLFRIQKGAYFEMRNSKLAWCGYEWGTNGDHSGLWINSDEIIIDGNLITNSRNGILFHDSSNNLIENNTICNNTFYGIFLRQSSNNNIISNNTIYNNSQYGLYLATSLNNSVRECIIFSNQYSGIYVYIFSNNRFTNNYIFNNTLHGIFSQQSSSNYFSGNKIFNNPLQGLLLDSNSNENILSNNRAYNNLKYGIYITSSHYNVIDDCTVSSNTFSGIILSSSTHNYIKNTKVFSNSLQGVLLTASKYNTLSNNTIYNNTLQGIYFDSSSNNNQLLYGDYYNNSHGVCIRLSKNNIINHINIINNKNGGVYVLSSPNYNLIVNSSIDNQNGYDFRIASNSHPTVLNSTFNKTRIQFDDTGSTLTVQWYLHVMVINFANIPIINATVNVRDNSNGTYDKSFTTGLEGYVKWIVTTEYIQDSSMIIYLTPHHTSATYKEYAVNVTPKPLIDRTTTIVIRLKIPGNHTMLYPGWNLISFPYIQSNNSIKAILQSLEGHYNIIQWYNSSDVNDHWKHYYTLKPSNLNDLKELNHKMGFWIHVTSTNGASFLFDGVIPTLDQTIELKQGWNLVGYPSCMSRLRDDALNNLAYGNDIRIIQYFDAKAQSWKNLETNEKMKKGIGYWFYANSDLFWIVNSTIFPVHNLYKDEYYETIQEGIDDADDSDIIEISEGAFYENVIINKSVTLIGGGINKTIIIGGFNITSDNVNLSYITISHSSHAIIFDSANKVYISNVLLYNCTDALNINNSSYINFEYSQIIDCLYGISSYNSSQISIISSTINKYTIIDFILENSNITVLNSIFNDLKIQFLDSNSKLIVQWFLNIHTKDQLNSSISGSTIEVNDNENGTFYGTYPTESDGFVRGIIVTERIQNITENITITPHNIIATHSDFSFYNLLQGIIINKSTTINILSVNTVYPTSIYNINRNRYYLTIQEAINDANSYNTIQLSSGPYIEEFNIDKPITLIGEGVSSPIINGNGLNHFNINSNDVAISNLNIENYTYGIYSNSYNGITLTNAIISNCTYGIFLDSCTGISITDVIIEDSTYGIFCNNSSPIIMDCSVDNNNLGIIGFNSSSPNIIDSILQNTVLDYSIKDSYFITLNTRYDTSKIMFQDTLSTLTVKWYLHVLVQGAHKKKIEGANVWIKDNANGTFDVNYITGPNGYVTFIVLTERIQNLTGNISFNPYWINVSYYETKYGYGWLTFPDNPRNISITGPVIEIRIETFTSLEIIPEFSDILFPFFAITVTFIAFRKRKKNFILHMG